MSVVRFHGGTDQQREWFRQATDECWPYDGHPAGRPRSFMWDVCNVRVDVHWSPDPGPPAQKENGWTQTWPDHRGLSARIDLHQDLDNPQSMWYHGEDYYKEVCLHEMGHVAAARLVMGNAREGDMIGLLTPRSSWNHPVWERAVQETAAELFKDAHAYAGQRKYLNRTQQRIRTSATRPMSLAWREFCDLWDRGLVQRVDYGQLPNNGVFPDYVSPVTLFTHIPPTTDVWWANKWHQVHIQVRASDGTVLDEVNHGGSVPGDNSGVGTGPWTLNQANCGLRLSSPFDAEMLPLSYSTWIDGFITGSGDDFGPIALPGGYITAFPSGPSNPMYYGSDDAPYPPANQTSQGAIISVTSDQ